MISAWIIGASSAANSFDYIEQYGKVEFKASSYFESPAYSEQNDYFGEVQIEPSLFIEQGSMKAFIQPRLRVGDTGASRADLREAHISFSANEMDIRIGSLLEFWGKTESYNPSDIINSYDYTSGLSDSQKLGAPAFKVSSDLNDGYFGAHNNLANTFRQTRKYKEAIKHFDVVDSFNAQSQSLECLYCDKNYTELFDRLNALSLSGSQNIRVAAVSAFVSHQLKKEDPYPFCKSPIDFFHTGNLKKYIENMDGFVNAVIAEAEQITSVWEPRNKTTVHGFQTRSTILEAGEKCAFLKDIIEQEIQSYYSKFSSADCSFISSWPEKYFLKGWYVRLVKNGHQESHIHPDGWVSGVVYLKTVNPKSNNEGAIEVGLHGYELPVLDDSYPRKVFQPQTGDIVLFPSSLFHKTIPFEEDTDRCVIAFDLYPIKS